MAAFRLLVIPFSFLLSLFFISVSLSAGSLTITDYQPIFRAGIDTSGNLRIAVRQYKRNNTPYLLLVNPVTLETATVREADIDFDRDEPPDALRNTPFVRALDSYTAPPYKLQNHGIVRAESATQGMFLTVDMCPSKRPYEKVFFMAVAEQSLQSGRGTPVAIAITGNWLENHPNEFAWIVRLIKDGKLAITWVNHSASHPFDPNASLDRNFLLTPGIDFEREVLTTERLLLERDLIPSVFFRFPGLVADGKLVRKLRELSLIPVGSDAWLAKGEIPKKGSIILVHGNGNEPQGILKALPLLRKAGHVKFLPLTEAIVGGVL
jgi:hypothetical protein